MAALVVVIHHCVAAIPALGGAYSFPAVKVAPEFNWLVYSPLHIVWAGQEAVYVFFILSGLVLALPARARPYNWLSYYPSRLIRLYAPVLFSVLAALCIASFIPRTLARGHGPWMANLAVDPSLVGVVKDITLEHPDLLNGPLWSLRWEIIFSLLLPIYLLTLSRFKRYPWWVILVCIAVSTAGTLTPHVWLTYMPMFMIGVCLAGMANGGGSMMRGWRGTVMCIAALLGISAAWWLTPVSRYAYVVALPIVLLSALVIVLSAIRVDKVRDFLGRKWAQWLGRISFSLYLIHYPIVIAVASLLPRQDAVIVLPIALPLSLLAAAVFFRWVELPAHRVAKAVGAALSRRHGSRFFRA